MAGECLFWIRLLSYVPDQPRRRIYDSRIYDNYWTKSFENVFITISELQNGNLS